MTEKNGKNVIHTEHLKKYYIMGDIEVRALHDISLDVRYGEFTAIMGPSGSGKSTLMIFWVVWIVPPEDYIFWMERMFPAWMIHNLQRCATKNWICFQSFNLLSRSSALENVMMPLFIFKK